MPKAPIHKDGDSRTAKSEIRPPKERLMPTPAGNSMGTQKFCEHKFCLFVAAPTNAGHEFRPFRLGKYVRHYGSY